MPTTDQTNPAPTAFDEPRAERDKLAEKAQDEMYLRVNQLAAISTVLMSNTPIELSNSRLPADRALYTAAFQDAVWAVEREIDLRQRFREQQGVINVLADHLARHAGTTVPDEIHKAREVVRAHESSEEAALGRCRQEGMGANDHNRRVYRNQRGTTKGNPYEVNSEEWKAWRDGYAYRDMVNDG